MERGRRAAKIKNTSIPAKAGISAATAAFADRRHWFPLSRKFPLAREEIPAFAGMEEGAGIGKMGERMEERAAIIFLAGMETLGEIV